MNIFLLDANNEQLGPFTSAEVKEGLALGKYQKDQLAFADGLSKWSPLSEVVAQLEINAPSPYQKPKVEVRYALFWQRLVAFGIDLMLIYAVQYVVNLAITVGFLGQFTYSSYRIFQCFCDFLIIAYFIGFESSSIQGTIGKAMMGIKVTDLAGNRITLFRAFCRWLYRWLSGLLFMAGYLMMLISDRKQTLHDLMAKTLVLSK